VRKAVDEALARRAARVEVKADDVLRELLTLAKADLRKAFDEHGHLRPVQDWPDDVAAFISSVDVEELWEGRGEDREQVGVVKKIKLWSKPHALELLAKHLGLLIERRRLETPDGQPLQVETKQGLSDETVELVKARIFGLEPTK
jgi:phage terminase small subunit